MVAALSLAATLSITDWTAIGGSAVALTALGLSIYSIYTQRAVPFLEAQLVNDLETGATAVAVRNTGSRSARAPWVMFGVVDGSVFFVNYAGPGFLAPGEGRYLVTTAPAVAYVESRSNQAEGVVGYIDRKGRHVIQPMGGGRSRRFASGTRSFLDMFREFYPGFPLQTQASLAEDRPLR